MVTSLDWDARFGDDDHIDFGDVPISKDEARVAHLRAMAGFIRNVADSLEEGSPAYPPAFGDNILNNATVAASEYARSSWFDYL